MINVSQYIKPELIITDIETHSKEDTIRRLVNKLYEFDSNYFPENYTNIELYKAVIERENIQTTGLGNAIAIPHTRINGYKDLSVVISISKEGIDWHSLDGKDCHVICLMISPTNKPYLILQAMASLIRFLNNPENIAKISEQSLTVRDIAEILKSSVRRATPLVCARDIMRPVEKWARLDDSIEHVARVMHLNRLDILPVLDDDNKFYGEISCMDIFNYGIPDFFNQLQTISFMKNLDPFEKYFKYKKDLKVKDIYNKEMNTIPKDATLMEIIFEMTVKNKLKLFVVSEGKLVGIVDRFSIIDKILFF
ncbi:MAG: PTS sugar transporter subunit IIA [Phycisphaerae bacterium]|nr:PTS sugar transporter subunit IIA [Phycisphaerae bacterium]